jgi:1-acyl-sn-glycerol-3-phosphate acyltransferase
LKIRSIQIETMADPVAKSPNPRVLSVGNRQLAIGNEGDPTRRSILWRTLAIPARFSTTLLFDLKVFGLEHIPPTGGAILAANHQSYLDPILLGVRLRRPLSYMAKSELFGNRFFAWLIRSLHAFPVRQGSGDVGAIKESVRRVQDGYLLNIYPEGTRSEDGELQPALNGVALVVRRAGVPVIPAVIDGAFDAWPPHRKLPRARGPIIVMYGPAMTLEGLKGEAVTRVIDQTFRSMMERARQKRREIQENDPWLRRRKV